MIGIRLSLIVTYLFWVSMSVLPAQDMLPTTTLVYRVSSLPRDPAGFRGAILLKMGTYSLEKPIYIKASGVVLRGEGMGDTGTILFGKIARDGSLFVLYLSRKLFFFDESRFFPG